MSVSNRKYEKNTRFLFLMLGTMCWIFPTLNIGGSSAKYYIPIFVTICITTIAAYDQGFHIIYTKIINKNNLVYFFIGIIFVFTEILNKSSLKLPVTLLFLVINSYIHYELLLEKDEIASYLVFFSRVFTLFMLIATLYAFFMSVSYTTLHYKVGKTYQELKLFQFELKQLIGSYPPYRLSSFFINPNTFGLFVVIALSMQILSQDESSLSQSIFKLLSIILLLYALLRTGSRASQVFLAIFFFLYALFGNGFKKIRTKLFKNIKYIFIFLILLVFVILFMFKTLLSRGLTLSGRGEIWIGTLSYLKGNYLLGIGSRNYNGFLLENYGISHAHNSYIQLLGSGGILYLFTYLFIQYKIISKSFFISLKQYEEKEKIVVVYIRSFFMAKLIYMFFESTVLMDSWFNYYTLFLIYILNDLYAQGVNVAKNRDRKSLKEIVKTNKLIHSIYSFIGTSIIDVLSIFVRKDDFIFIISFGGVKIDDSPQILLDALLEDPKFEAYQFILASNREVFLNSQYVNNKRVIHVRPDSFKYYYFLLKSQVWITNTSVKRGLHFKARNTIHVNTWHGTPLKKIGRDVVNDTTFQSKDDFSDTDLFTVQSTYDADKFKSAFGLKEEQILMSGLPRNDVLFNVTEKDVRYLRRKLKIPENKTIILYAPTYRDYTESSSAYINIPKFMENLDEDYYFLYRSHHSMGIRYPEKEFNRFMDVSTHPHLHELLIVSDILISDYSSISVDYSILNRPIILYLNDLEEYKEKRGLYFDLEQEFPEHVLTEQDQVLKSLNEKDTERYRPIRFRNKFIQVNGHSTQKILDQIKKEL